MDNFIQFWDSLGNYKYIFTLCGLFFLYHLIFVVYKSFVICSKEKSIPLEEEEGVSVIITSNNRAEELRENLPAFLEQDYPDFEVIVVDECSEDNTQDVLAELQVNYPNLRTTRIFPETKFRNTKKLAINIGILAAKNDILLFSEINCRPDSSGWIKAMRSYFGKKTAVVLGYANYAVGKRQVNVRRFFRFCRYLKMLLLVKGGCNVFGEGRNMGYRKKFYIAKKGFSKNTQSYMGYDNEMVCTLSEMGKVYVAGKEETFVTINDDKKKTWTEDFTYYVQNKRKWPVKALLKLDTDTFIRLLFYILGFVLIFKQILCYYIIACILLTFLIDFIATNVYLKHLKQKKLFLISFIINLIGFLYRWYYNMYSIFTRKKWR